MIPLIIFLAPLVFCAGWVVGTAQSNSRTWRESVDRSRGYQRYIDELEARLKMAPAASTDITQIRREADAIICAVKEANPLP